MPFIGTPIFNTNIWSYGNFREIGTVYLILLWFGIQNPSKPFYELLPEDGGRIPRLIDTEMELNPTQVEMSPAKPLFILKSGDMSVEPSKD